ncbi:hypothetical protein UlMin_018549 [Ulmus minor]
MAMPPMGPPAVIEGGPPAAQPLPGTDMTGICFRDLLWLNSYPLDRNLVFDYFALSPFYDWTRNNEQLRMRSIHPHPFDRNLDLSRLSDGPEKVTPMLTYYVLDGSIYQAPQLCNVFAARVGRARYYISKAFTTAASKLEKIGYVDSEIESAAFESKVGKETIDFKEAKRVDHILASLQRKLPPAPPPPPFPEGYVPPATAESEKGPETQQAGEAQPPTVDPIIDQGPAKRMILKMSNHIHILSTHKCKRLKLHQYFY